MRILGIVLTLFLGVAIFAVAQAPPSTAKGGRVFEMRTYYASAGKLEALHARFRDHTTKLFEKHGMTNVGYWVPIDGQTGASTGNTLVYILAYPSLEARKKAWDAFQNDPEWKSVKETSEKDGKLVDKVDSVFLSPTDYSAIK
jgi:NIPSNAP protein